MDVRPQPGQKGLSVGVGTDAGAKEQNDDRLAATDVQELGFLAGVFDGHRGSDCADWLSKGMPRAVLDAYRVRAKREGNSEGSLVKLSSQKEASLISSALVDAFEAMDKAWMVAARKKDLTSGSTALVALISHGFEAPVAPTSADSAGCAALWPKPKEEEGKQQQQQQQAERRAGTVGSAPGGVAKLFTAWAGDCRAVLLRGRTGLRVTEDHRPNKGDEQKRIQRAGGTVLQDSRRVWRVGPRADNKFVRELKGGKRDDKMRWFLSTSRGFGDPELKQPDPIVIATPDVKTVDLTPEDWAVVMGSDGIFDCLSDQFVADLVWKAMVLRGKNPVDAARELVATALKAGSRDNSTAVVMRFGWSEPPPADSVVGAGGAATAGGGEAVEASDSLNMFGS